MQVVLETGTTGRDARPFLSKFKAKNLAQPASTEESHVSHAVKLSTATSQESQSARVGKSRGSTSAAQSFQDLPEEDVAIPHSLALLKLRVPQKIDDRTMRGISLTVSQMSLLGMTSIVVLDSSDPLDPKTPLDWQQITGQVGRVVSAFKEHDNGGVMYIQDALEIIDHSDPSLLGTGEKLKVCRPEAILRAISREIIPVLAPIAWNRSTKGAERVSANDVVLALADELSGKAPTVKQSKENLDNSSWSIQTYLRHPVDRVIVLDPLGDIPSSDPTEGTHTFVNLLQEYDAIQEDLRNSKPPKARPQIIGGTEEVEPRQAEASTHGDTASGLNADRPRDHDSVTDKINKKSIESSPTAWDIHSANLKLLRDALKILPKTSSGLITTPSVAAKTARQSTEEAPSGPIPGPQRRRGNLLVRNLLTDKPLESSSLPKRPAHLPPATFIKRGCDVTIIPDPRTQPWIPPTPGSPPALTLSDPRIDTARLIALIENSFSRPLDYPHYADRISRSLAGLIIAGPYEGCALLTWEFPHPTRSSPTPSPVPYLDKFAILKSAQGAGGISDIIWKSMVKECFPEGVVWRSRKENKVNGWYADRSQGNVDLGGTGWRMFWTKKEGAGFQDGEWEAYESVCRNVEPSWADGEKPD